MADCSFVDYGSLCISQSNAISAAFVAAIASIATTGWKIFADAKAATARRRFEREEREQREAFEATQRTARETFEKAEQERRTAFEESQAERSTKSQTDAQARELAFQESERTARESFERQERLARQEFADAQAIAQREAEVRIKKETETYIQLEKWKQESWKRKLERIQKASAELDDTVSGLILLIDDGPDLGDFKMITETAKVLDVFGDFQTSAKHYSLRGPVGQSAEALIKLITQILLTLSPIQEVRRSDKKKADLLPLKAAIIDLKSDFDRLCGQIDTDPRSIDGDAAA